MKIYTRSMVHVWMEKRWRSGWGLFIGPLKFAKTFLRAPHFVENLVFPSVITLACNIALSSHPTHVYLVNENVNIFLLLFALLSNFILFTFFKFHIKNMIIYMRACKLCMCKKVIYFVYSYPSHLMTLQPLQRTVRNAVIKFECGKVAEFLWCFLEASDNTYRSIVYLWTRTD